VTTALRAAAPTFAATVKLVDPEPVPLVLNTVTHPAFEDATHEQLPPEAVTFTEPPPPPAGWKGLFAEIEKLHGAPGCETRKPCPPIWTFAVLSATLEFASSDKLTVPIPDPLWPVVTCTHAGPGSVVQEQPVPTFMVTEGDTAPPVQGAEPADAVSE
jgi:hypothetical protein